jgi:hypothetical protein
MQDLELRAWRQTILDGICLAQGYTWIIQQKFSILEVHEYINDGKSRYCVICWSYDKKR